jgi:hypothetical protein
MRLSDESQSFWLYSGATGATQWGRPHPPTDQNDRGSTPSEPAAATLTPFEANGPRANEDRP